MQFEYAALTLPAECLRAIWSLTMDVREWGGQLRPAVDPKDGRCKLSCRDVTLIRGTTAKDHPDGALYAGNRRQSDGEPASVRVAVTPFYREIFQRAPLCGDSRHVNLIFHTHPLHMMGSIWAPSPPSMGDIVAHCVLGNYRNYKQNKGQLNAMLVMSFEGLYVYNVLPWRFAQEVARLDAGVAQVRNSRRLSRSEATLAAMGHVPVEVAEAAKHRLFEELRPLNDLWMPQLGAFMRANRKDLSIEGAPLLGDTRWGCATRGVCAMATAPHELNFPMARSLLGRRDLAVLLGRDSAFLRGLTEHGFTYAFIPAPFRDEVTVSVPCRAAPLS